MTGADSSSPAPLLRMLCSWVAMLCMLGAYLAWHERQRVGTPQQTWHGW